MKIEKFLYWVNSKLLKSIDINFPTVKIFMDNFAKCLSPTELKRYSLMIDMIREYTSKQISLDSFVEKSKVEILESELNNLKNGVK